jgi:hypothetical protein
MRGTMHLPQPESVLELQQSSNPELQAMKSTKKRRKYVKRLPPGKDYRSRMWEERYAERNQAILARRAAGVIFERIGDEFGLSGEQVRQIVLKAERKAKEGKEATEAKEGKRPPR